MPKAIVLSQTITYNGNTYKHSMSGKQWWVHMWGWWPQVKNPMWKWIQIVSDKVPIEVRDTIKRQYNGD